MRENRPLENYTGAPLEVLTQDRSESLTANYQVLTKTVGVSSSPSFTLTRA